MTTVDTFEQLHKELTSVKEPWQTLPWHLTLVEASKLQQGDIMVCEMTVPTWVPLFATVSGIVADSGGILSHCAIVAREFHLPAVVGTRVGTTTIKDGMIVTVDGTKGMVRIESRR